MPAEQEGLAQVPTLWAFVGVAEREREREREGEGGREREKERERARERGREKERERERERGWSKTKFNLLEPSRPLVSYAENGLRARCGRSKAAVQRDGGCCALSGQLLAATTSC